MKYLTVFVVGVLLLRVDAFAQQTTASIGGFVKKTSGAGVPGVTVADGGPALIVKVGSRRNDVGGDHAEQSNSVTLHGGRGDDGRTNYDGMGTNIFTGTGGGQRRIYKFNTMGVDEIVLNTGGSSAENENGGATVNMVPRDG